MSNTTLKNKASFVIPSVGTTNSNEVIATVLQFNVIKKQNSVTTPINVQTGDTVTYTVEITNPTTSAISNISFSDTIPTGMTYITGSFKVNSSVVSPTITGQVLSYNLTSLNASATTTIEFKVTVN